MIGNYHGLLGKIDDLSGDLWREYSRSLEGSGDWEESDASDLMIAWLVATKRITIEDLEAGLKVFKEIGNLAVVAPKYDMEFGPNDFVGAVMHEAEEEMSQEK